MAIIGLYAGILGLVLLVLSYKVVSLRKTHKVGIGDGEFSDLQQAIRTQANFIEYVPFCLILLTIIATMPISPYYLHLSGSVLVLARILHAMGLLKESGYSRHRYWGTLLTWILILGLSIANIGIFILTLF
jgi:uncharacterized membrane protein YecN with MAPEG domain